MGGYSGAPADQQPRLRLARFHSPFALAAPSPIVIIGHDALVDRTNNVGRYSAPPIAALAVALQLAHADPPPQTPTPAKCRSLIDKRWTPAERFAWTRICVGEEADFNKDPQFGGTLDPKRPEGLPDNRT